MPPWKPLLPLTTAAVQPTNHRSPDTKLLVVGIYGPLLLLLWGSMLGRVVRSGGVWCGHPCAPGRNVNPGSRLSAEMFTYRPEQASVSQRGQQARAFLASPEKISSVAFLLARRRETPIPQQQELHSRRPCLSTLATPPLLHPSLFSISSSDLSILSAPWSPCYPPPLPKILSGIPEQKGHRCHTWSYYYEVKACVITDINLEEKSTLGRSYIVVHHQSVRYRAFQKFSWDKM